MGMEADGVLDEGEKQVKFKMEEVLETLLKLRGSVHRLVMQGTQAFILTCLLQALFYVVQIWMVSLNLQTVDTFVKRAAQAKFYFQGMGLIASSAAISNIILVESDFESFLHLYKPFLK